MSFNQPDTLIPDPLNVLDWNRYAYARYNPVRFIDPTGHSVWDFIGQFSTGFVKEFALRNGGFITPQAQNVLAVNQAESDASIYGRIAADAATVVLGVENVIAGAGIASGGTAVACGVTLCLAAGATVAGGVAVAAVGVTQVGQASAGLGQNLSRLAGQGASNAPNISFDPRRLQHEFAFHSKDFGISGNWNKSTSSQFKEAILNHIRGNNTQPISGTYRGTIKVTHYYDPTTNLWVAVDESGNYVAGWKLDQDQIDNLLNNGNIQ